MHGQDEEAPGHRLAHPTSAVTQTETGKSPGHAPHDADGGTESLVCLPEQQRGVDPVEVVEVGAGGQGQAAVVVGHQVGHDGHL